MEHQNITLSLPRELLLKIKHIAVDRNMSVSKLLAKTLEEIADREDSYVKAKADHLNILECGVNAGTEGQSQWRREDLHER